MRPLPPDAGVSMLATQQARLRQAIVAGTASDEPAGLLRARPGGGTLLRIYAQAYTARLVAALRDNYGVLPRVLGDAAFDALAQAYVREHPSPHASIRWFGDRLADFMALRDDLVAHPAMIDIARMEWALRGAFDAADAEPIAPSSLADVPAAQWQSLAFDALPSMRLVRLAWAIEPVWRALQHDDAAVPAPEPWLHGLVVWRRGLETRWRSLDTAAADLLDAALRGAPFADLCACAAQAHGSDVAAGVAAAALRGWIDDGLLAGWRLVPPA